MENNTSYNLQEQPLVSIALCTYNGAAFLRPQMDTLIGQTYQNLEIVVVDDGSKDDTISILESYAAIDNRIRIYCNEKNMGFNRNYEKACRLTRGAYIAIADQDDIWAPEKIELMMKNWKNNNLFAYSISRNFSGEEPIFGEENKPIILYEGSVPEKLVFDSPVHGHASMFRRELLDAATPFPEDVFYDWWLSMVASVVDSVCCIPITLSYHRVHDDNSSRTLTSIHEKEERLDKLRKQSLHFIETFLQRFPSNNNTDSLLEKYAKLLRQKKDNRFSRALFIFYFKNRDITFHYKRKRNIFSLLKNSIKKSFSGL